MAQEKVDFDYLKPSSKECREIQSAFQKYGYKWLKLVYDCLDKKYTYDQIRLIRVISNTRQSRREAG